MAAIKRRKRVTKSVTKKIKKSDTERLLDEATTHFNRGMKTLLRHQRELEKGR